ncbi:MAG TPA: hypothetical protein ENG74_03550, partial [Thermoplasmatales archaeon]|nr:hypothetical protein [Thermoplasmatales archaeon]
MHRRNSLAVTLVFLLLILSISGCIEKGKINHKPTLSIEYPLDGAEVYGILIIRGTADDLEGNLKLIQVKVDGGKWSSAIGLENWSYQIDTELLDDGYHEIYARAWDGELYSDIYGIKILVRNAERNENIHKWALFVAVANREDAEEKLGNGMLTLAEEMAKFFIENLNYPASHVTILFDDGWIRSDNGEGEPIFTLQERLNKIRYVSYGASTKENVEYVINKIKEKANQYDDSEVFIWLSGHGLGDADKKFTGGKILEHSQIALWDEVLEDTELGEMLSDLNAKTCIIIDACYSGGFANKAILNFPTLTKSNLPANNRIVITGESKFTVGYSSNIAGPLFT